MPEPIDRSANYGNALGDGSLRPNGQQRPLNAPLEEKNLPSTRSPASEKQMPPLQVVRDCVAGHEVVNAKGTEYLPKAPAESQSNYNVRLKRAVFYGVTGHTVAGLTGLVFSKDPKLSDDVPAPIKEHWENIDLAGTHGDVFAREIFADAQAAGHAAILVEFPKTGGAQRPNEENKALAGDDVIRPYWILIRKEDIMSWRTKNVRGRTVLTQLVIRECNYVSDGDFGEKLQTQYRVFVRDDTGSRVRILWKLLEVTADRVVTEVEKGECSNQVEIPVAEIPTSGKESIFVSRPPLFDLSQLNLSHYRTSSDYDTSIHKTCVPIFATIGLQEVVDGLGQLKEVEISADRGLDLPPNGDAKYVSHDGAALGSVRQKLEDDKSDMAALGLSMLQSSKRAAETAEAKRIDKATESSKLAVSARGLQDGLERALGFHAKYLKLPSGGSVEINRDFENVIMGAEVMMAYAALVQAGFPKALVMEMLRRGGRIPEDADVDALAMEWDARLAAAEEAERAEAEDNARILLEENKKVA